MTDDRIPVVKQNLMCIEIESRWTGLARLHDVTLETVRSSCNIQVTITDVLPGTFEIDQEYELVLVKKER